MKRFLIILATFAVTPMVMADDSFLTDRYGGPTYLGYKQFMAEQAQQRAAQARAQELMRYQDASNEALLPTQTPAPGQSSPALSLPEYFQRLQKAGVPSHLWMDYADSHKAFFGQQPGEPASRPQGDAEEMQQQQQQRQQQMEQQRQELQQQQQQMEQMRQQMQQQQMEQQQMEQQQMEQQRRGQAMMCSNTLVSRGTDRRVAEALCNR